MRRMILMLMAAALTAVITVFSAAPAFAQDEFVSGGQGGVFELEKKVFEKVCFIFPALCSDEGSDDGSDDASSSARTP